MPGHCVGVHECVGRSGVHTQTVHERVLMLHGCVGMCCVMLVAWVCVSPGCCPRSTCLVCFLLVPHRLCTRHGDRVRRNTKTIGPTATPNLNSDMEARLDGMQPPVCYNAGVPVAVGTADMMSGAALQAHCVTISLGGKQSMNERAVVVAASYASIAALSAFTST